MGTVEADTEELDGSRFVRGLSPRVSKEVRCKCEGSGDGRETRKRIRTTDSIQFVGVPIVLILRKTCMFPRGWG